MKAIVMAFFGKYQLALTALVIALLLGALGVQTLRLGEAQRDFADFRAATSAATATRERLAAQDIQKARETEQRLTLDKQKADDEKAHAILVRDQRIAALADSLRQRTQRPAQPNAVAPAAAPEQTCTGAGLYREDGQFLAGEAAAAAAIAGERDYYFERYEAARQALSKGQQP